MKLYATVTSERATKGQGGNKELVIKLYGGSTTDSKHLATVYLFPDLEPNEYLLHVRTPEDELLFGQIVPITKGKNQKGEEHWEHCEMHDVSNCIHCHEW